MDLTDQQWALIQPIISERHPPSISTVGGRPPIDPRPILNGILWKIRSAVPWADLPACYPSHQTCFRRYRLWQSAGTLSKIFDTLFTDLLHRGRFDPQGALHEGAIIVTFQENRYQIYVKADLLDTWELSTSIVFVQIALAKHRHSLS